MLYQYVTDVIHPIGPQQNGGPPERVLYTSPHSSAASPYHHVAVATGTLLLTSLA